MTCGARGSRARRGALLVVAAVVVMVAGTDVDSNRSSAGVTACLPGGDGRAAAALAELAARTLSAGGLPAHRVPPPPACRQPARPDAADCMRATLEALATDQLAVALLPAPAAALPSAWRLRDHELDELGYLAPPVRHACWILPPGPLGPHPLRSLLDLADADVAMHYAVSPERLAATADAAGVALKPVRIHDIKSPDWCQTVNATCATLLTSGEDEALALLDVVREHKLLARVLALGAHMSAFTSALSPPAILCDWALEATEFDTQLARPLGPPPCSRDDCLFESRRIVKLVRTPVFARSHAAYRALLRLILSLDDVRALTALARDLEPTAAVEQFLQDHPRRVEEHEVRVTVFLPDNTPREAYDGVALMAAAALAEEDLEITGNPRAARFKVETYDDRCDAAHAYKYLLDAAGTRAYSELSAVAGPACGSAFADVARQSPTHALPVLAYSAQAPPAGARALLVAGDGRAAVVALAVWLERMRWRRVAVISEPATHPMCDTAALGVHVLEHLELADGEAVRDENIVQWARRVAALRGRIIYVCLEDARAVRAALCAGRAAALRPDLGAVWILPAALPSHWSTPKPGDAHNCTLEELEGMAAGHLSVGPEWLINWKNGAMSVNASDAWRNRWRLQCLRLPACARPIAPDAHAALLYDTLRLWAAAVDRVMASRSVALDLHDPDVVRSLVTSAVEAKFVGVTGAFEWNPTDEERNVYARESPIIVSQWNGSSLSEVARWSLVGGLRVAEEPQWRTTDGSEPDDGGDDCSVRPLADLLGADCAAAYAALGALLLALAVAALAAAALYFRRRAERDYRAKLEALGMRALIASEPVELDRWELPRERVVINRKLGMGAFGTVYGGHALLAEGRPWTAVAVKTLKPGASVDEKLDFLSEAEAMKRFDHRNVVRLLAVVTKTEPVCTVMEFMLYGDLKNYLLARRHLAAGGEGEEEADEVSARRLTGMALDAARALAYLARLRYVHRDVAARNCLVSSRRVVKLADFGMTRLVFENDYYRFSRKGMLPVRWMAPESLALGVFSPASDVWSFGVLLYEIVTFGSLPFQGLSNSEVLARVKAGHTLDLPPGINPELEDLILGCWRRERAARPAAAELADALAAAPRLLQPCLDAPLDALPLGDPPWHLPPDRAQARWVSWGAPASQSQATDTTYLSDAAPRDSDRFLPAPPEPPDPRYP